MAFYDNRLWLLSHIHNSFTSSDETGICEIVMGDNLTRDLTRIAHSQGLEKFLPYITEGEQEPDYDRRSPDIKVGVVPGERFRKRADTELQMQQRLVQQKDGDQSNTVTWKSVNDTPDSETMTKLFPRKQLGLQRQEGKVSLLSAKLESLGTVGQLNPWQEFARFDGSHYTKDMVKNVELFPNMQGDNPVPLQVSCVKDAKVREVVGLICYKYSQEGREPVLVHNKPEMYGLYMCEEEGSVDRDFPCLDWSETFSKYGFPQLALVERDPGDEGIGASSERVTLHMPDGTFSELEVERGGKETLGDLLERGLQRRKRTFSTTGRGMALLSYHLEAAEVVGVPLDPTLSLSSHTGTEFYIVRSNSKRMSGTRTDKDQPVSFLEAPLFQSFDVQMVTKVRTKVDIHLGISGEKVEIDPKPQASWTVYKQKAATYDMDNIVSCQVVGRNQGEERLVMKMVHLADNGWRWIEFEGSKDTIEAVVDKVNHLLDMRQSEARKLRKEYLENKEKKKIRPRIALN